MSKLRSVSMIGKGVSQLWSKKPKMRKAGSHIGDRADDRPETTKEHVRRETEEEDTLTENKGDWGSRKGWDVPGVSGSWERG